MRNRRRKLARLFLGGMLALALVALVSATETGSSEAQQGAMQNCPSAGKWAIAAWDGDDGADAEQALGTCGEGAVAVAYSIDPYTQAWSRWFAERADVSNLLTLNNMQGVMVLGGAQARTAPASPTPSPTATPTPTPTAAAAGGPPTDYLDTFHAAIDMSMEMDMFGMDFAVEGDFEAPDSCSCDATASMLGIPLIDQQLIVIGNKAWIDTGDGWRETTPSDPEVAGSLGMCPACPGFWEEFAFEAPPLPGEHETKNGVPAIHYTLAELYEAFAGIGLIPEELEGVSVDALDVWVAEDGKWLVCLDMEICVEAEAMEEFTGPLEGVDSVCMAMSIDITRASDSSIQVNAPLAGSSGSSAQQDAMHNCPRPGKWAISVWGGDDGTDAEQAFATCGQGAVAVAYSIDPETQAWSRWFAGRPEISNLAALDNMQGVMALGGEALAENQELRVQILGEPMTLDPQIAAFSTDISIIKQLFRGLLWYDEDLNVVPAAAKVVPSQENGGISEDGLTYAFELRDDLVWSDGEPLTAADFEYSLKRLFDPEVGGKGYYYSFYTNIVGAQGYVDGEGSADDVEVTALGDTTLEIKLTTVQPTLLQLMAMWPALPVRQDVIEEHGDAWTEAGNLVGNGPFILTEWEHRDHITVEANPNYWGDDKPTLQRIVFQMIPDESIALIAYQDDMLDMTRIPLPDTRRFEGDPEQLKYAELVTFAQEFNNAEEPFTDPLVRKAFKMAVDSQAYVDSVRQGSGLPANSWIPPGMPGYNSDIGTDYAFDPEGAKDLLAQSTYGGPDGLPDVTVTIADTQAGRLTAEFLQEQLRSNLDVSIEIEILESATYEDRYLASEFQFVLGGWGADYADPENWLPELFGTGASLNQYKYSNPEVDDLFAQAAVELDNDKRLDLYDQAQTIIIDEDMAIAPLYVRIRNWLVKPSVDGVTTTGLDSSPGDWFYTNIRMLAH